MVTLLLLNSYYINNLKIKIRAQGGGGYNGFGSKLVFHHHLVKDGTSQASVEADDLQFVLQVIKEIILLCFLVIFFNLLSNHFSFKLGINFIPLFNFLYFLGRSKPRASFLLESWNDGISVKSSLPFLSSANSSLPFLW